jgi:hypothetical protein
MDNINITTVKRHNIARARTHTRNSYMKSLKQYFETPFDLDRYET